MNDIQISYHSVKLMRDAARENIATYCTQNNNGTHTDVTPSQVWEGLTTLADRYNVCQPDEYIRRMYNLSCELRDNKPLTIF